MKSNVFGGIWRLNRFARSNRYIDFKMFLSNYFYFSTIHIKILNVSNMSCYKKYLKILCNYIYWLEILGVSKKFSCFLGVGGRKSLRNTDLVEYVYRPTPCFNTFCYRPNLSEIFYKKLLVLIFLQFLLHFHEFEIIYLIFMW